MIVVYGLKTCDTCRKALKWLMEEGIPHRFHDFRTDGVPADAVRGWVDRLGWQAVINRRSTTWRALGPDAAEGLDDPAAVVALVEQHPALVKRPLFDLSDTVLLGFTDATRATLKSHAAETQSS